VGFSPDSDFSSAAFFRIGLRSVVEAG